MDSRATWITELGKSPKTAKTYCAVLRILARHADKSLTSISTDDVRALLRSGYSPKTKQVVVTAVRAFHLWGVLEGKWKSNGLAAVRAPKVTPFPHPPLHDHAVRALLAGCRSGSEYRIVVPALYGGLRVSESAALTEKEWKRDHLYFVGKGAKPRKVPLHPVLEEHRAVILQSSPLSDSGAGSAFDRLRSRVGVTATTHDLRRTFGTHLYERCEAPWEVVAKILGHGEDVTALYARISLERMREFVDKVDYYSGEPVQLSLFE